MIKDRETAIEYWKEQIEFLDILATKDRTYHLTDCLFNADDFEGWFYAADEAVDIPEGCDVADIFCGTGASRGVLISNNCDWVAKIDFDEYIDTAYNETESRIYEAAVRYGVENFFAETFEAFNIFGRTIYLQKKCICDSTKIYEDSKRVLEQKRHYSDRLGVREVCDKILSTCDSRTIIFESLMYTEKQSCVYRLRKFVKEEGINDLHCGNYGYRDGHLVIVDYAGFYD